MQIDHWNKSFTFELQQKANAILHKYIPNVLRQLISHRRQSYNHIHKIQLMLQIEQLSINVITLMKFSGSEDSYELLHNTTYLRIDTNTIYNIPIMFDFELHSCHALKWCNFLSDYYTVATTHYDSVPINYTTTWTVTKPYSFT